MKIFIIRNLTLLLFLLPVAAQAQISISESGSDPDPSSILDLKSTDKGFLVPRMSDVERDAIANPATGLLVFVNIDSSFYYYDGTAWQRVSPAPNAQDLADAAGFPDGVLHTEPLQTPGESFQIVVENNYAYVNRKNFGNNLGFLDVYDVSSPNNVSHTTAYSSMYMQFMDGMDVIGSTAAISEGANLELIDFSNPANPAVLLQKNDGLNPKLCSKFYSDDILFSHAGFFGSGTLEIREVSTSTIKLLTLGGEPVDIAFSGTYAFVTNNGSDQLQVIEFSSISAASVVHTVALGTDPGSISVSGIYAYVANNGNDMLEVIDISNPLTASVVHTVSVGSDPRQVHTNGHYAFVLDGANALFQTIYINNPVSAYLQDTVNIGGSPQYFDIEGGYAYVVNNNGGNYELQVLTIPVDNNFIPSYGPDGSISGYSSQSDLNQQIDLFNLSGNNLQLSITGDGEAPRTVDLSGFLDNTDAQALSLNSNTLSLTNGGAVDLSGYLDNTDAQSLSLNSNTLSLTNGGAVDLSAYLDADDLGNHTATENLQLNGNWLSNDGGNEGIWVDNAGRVGIGTSTPIDELHIEGSIRMVDGNQQAGYIAVSDANGTMTWSEFERMSLDSLFGSPPANGTPLLDASMEQANNGTITQNVSWQSFTAERTGSLVQVDFNHLNNGIDNGTLVIYKGQGTSGPILHEQQISGTTDWSSYPLTAEVEVTAGTQYTAELIGVDNFTTAIKSGNPYAGGRHISLSSVDALFRTFVKPATVVYAVDTTGSVSLANGSLSLDENGDASFSGDVTVDGLVSIGNGNATIDENGNAYFSGDVTINGQLSMKHNIAWGETTATQYKQDETVGATYQNITTTSSLDVKTGDILKIEGWVSMKMNEGSGTDLFNIRVSASGCSNFTTNLLDNIGPPRDSGDRQDYRQYSYGDVHVAPCDGTYTFTLQINNTGDDDWIVKDALLIVTKY